MHLNKLTVEKMRWIKMFIDNCIEYFTPNFLSTPVTQHPLRWGAFIPNTRESAEKKEHTNYFTPFKFLQPDLEHNNGVSSAHKQKAHEHNCSAFATKLNIHQKPFLIHI